MSEAASELTPVRLLANAGSWRNHAMTDSHSISTLCACGCGAMAPVGKKCCHGHHMRLLRGADHPSWKGGVWKALGYVYLYMPAHAAANSRGYVRRSKLVAEAKIGRSLLSGEIVHHINSIRDDDRPENVEVMTQSEHMALHQRDPFMKRATGQNNGNCKARRAERLARKLGAVGDEPEDEA